MSTGCPIDDLKLGGPLTKDIEMKCRIETGALHAPVRAGVGTWAVAALLVVLPQAVLAQPSTRAGTPQMNRPQVAEEEPRAPADAHGARNHGAPRSIRDPDRDFAIRIRKHEEDALKLAEGLLKDGADAEMRAIAQSMIDTRRHEIAKLDAWIARRKPPENKPIPRML